MFEPELIDDFYYRLIKVWSGDLDDDKLQRACVIPPEKLCLDKSKWQSFYRLFARVAYLVTGSQLFRGLELSVMECFKAESESELKFGWKHW